jgi:TolB-like protein
MERPVPEGIPFRNAITREKARRFLPFQAVNEDRELRALSDGMAEVLTSQLSQLEQLQGSFSVVPASEIRSRKINSVDEAHKQYGVNLAITGSIQRQGDKSMLFTANIVDAVNMRQIRATTFDVGLSDLKALREGVTRQVVGLLDMETTTQSDQALRMKETDRAEAYFAYLEGRGYLHRFDIAGNIDRAIERWRKPERGPTLCPGVCRVGRGILAQGARNERQSLCRPRGRLCAQGCPVGGSLAVPHVKLGEIYTQSGQQQEAIREFQLALASQPASADAYRGLGRAYSSIGLKQEAENAYLQAVRLRPNDWYAHNLLGSLLLRASGSTTKPNRPWIKARELTPDNEYPYRNLGMVYLATGKIRCGQGAIPKVQRNQAVFPRSPWTRPALVLRGPASRRSSRIRNGDQNRAE